MFKDEIPLLLVVGRWKYEDEQGRPAITDPRGVLFSWNGPIIVSESGGVYEVPNLNSLLCVLPVVEARWFFVFDNNEVL